VTAAKHFWKWDPLVGLRAIAARIQLFLLPRNLLWFAVSDFNRDALLGKGFRRVTVVPCVIPDQVRALKSQRPTLLFVGRVSPNKNVLQLLDSYMRVARSVSASVPLLTIVGTRKPRCRYGDAFEKRLTAIQRDYPVVWHREPMGYSELQR